MAQFTAEVFQNEYLPDGGTDVHAIVNIACAEAPTAGQSGSVAGEIIIVDTSGSMGQGNNMIAAKQAAIVALDTIADGTWFAIVAGNHRAYLAYPIVQTGAGMVQMNPTTRMQAKEAVGYFRADGGTAIGSWLNLTRALFDSVGIITNKHALLLTDGENHNETTAQLDQAIFNCLNQFQCDCRGIGVDWKVEELRKVSQALLGTVDIIPSADRLAAEFAMVLQRSGGRGISGAELRLWTPQGAQVLFVRQVSPTVEDLTMRAREVNQLTRGYPTGAWGNESRDYHVAVRLAAKALGQEQLAARVQLTWGEDVVAQGLVKAKWSPDAGLTARIAPEVAHYTGQTELASAIQEGLAAKAAGDEATATTKLGRAVQLAAATNNAEASLRLSKVVEVTDHESGTVRLRRHVDKADEMALDTASTKTTRVRSQP